EGIMTNILLILKRRKWLLTILLLAALVASQVQIADRDNASGQLSIGTVGEKVITLGSVAEAAGDTDYQFDGVADDIQFQAALDALPATGGRLVVVSATTIVFAAGTTVTRAIDNVAIEGTGRGTSFTGDGVTAQFTAGGNNWVLRDLRVDVNAATLLAAMGATTGWIWENVATSDVFFANRSPAGQSIFNDATVASLTDSGLTNTRVPIAGVGGLLGDDADMTFSGTTLTVAGISAPVGRVATFTVAASNATADEIAQADYVCDGTSDEVQILAAIAALPADGGKIVLSNGHFNVASTIVINSPVFFQGSGRRFTQIVQTTGGLNLFEVNSSAYGSTFQDFSFASVNNCGFMLTNLHNSTFRNLEGRGAAILFNLRGCLFNHFIGVTISTNYPGLFAGAVTWDYAFKMDFHNGIANNANTWTGVVIEGGSNGLYWESQSGEGASAFLGGCIEGQSVRAVFGFEVSGITFVGTWFEGATSDVYFESSANISLLGTFRYLGKTELVNTTNTLITGGTHGTILMSGTSTRKYQNNEYISPGETRTASGTLTAGIANAIALAWHNPEAQDIIIRKVVIEITTAGGTATAVLDVGIADDAAGTNRGVEFFNDINANAADVNDSWVAGDGGTQTKWVVCQDSASVTDGWIVGQILVETAASMVGRYYIEYVGR
ncbi:MAG: hypothetical protein KKH61_20835, partial [Gammaproteobacteria bacterium]|nr:hypothetical protein [Gammaproteobacteria bacterium]